MQGQYEVGAHIRYGGVGICLIARIEEVPYPGDRPTRLCYVLKSVTKAGMEITVPLDHEVLCAKIQPIRTKKEIEALIADAVSQEPQEWQSVRKLRTTEFRRVISGGDAAELMQLIRCIWERRKHLHKTGKHLSAADDNALKDAERILVDEFSFSLNLPAGEVNRYLAERLGLK